MSAANAPKAGIALMEVIVALILVTVVGVPLLARVGAEARLLVQRIDQEALLRTAEGALAEYASLERTRLEQRLGRRAVGSLDVLLDRPSPTLFRIVVVQPDAGDRALMATHVYRPEP